VGNDNIIEGVFPSAAPSFPEDTLKETESDNTNNEGKKNMSDTISKDWIEKRLQDADHKRELDRKEWQSEVKDMDHRFNLLISESNAKFDKLFAEMKSESEKNILRVEASISKAQLQIIIWVIGTFIAVTFGALRFLPPSSNVSEEIRKPVASVEHQVKPEIPSPLNQENPDKKTDIQKSK
jgi:hypothetical protein